jgi:hypothetical protein
MAKLGKLLTKALALIACLPCCLLQAAEDTPKHFKVVAFYTGTSDLAHVSFIREAKEWFPKMAAENHFSFEATTNWSRLNPESLKDCQVVVFWDTRPELPAQRQAFQEYMERGGAWMGFHFAGFALTPSDYPQNWDWYHETFLGVGEYVSNTWRPVPAVLRVEVADHPATRGLPPTFRSAPSEWYRWQHNLRTNADFRVLLSVDPSSFPLGTGPKAHEIWHSGDYPIVWTNQKYRMIYFNFGHNDIDYEHKTNRELSSSFASESQNRLVLNSLLWLGRGGAKAGR